MWREVKGSLCLLRSWEPRTVEKGQQNFISLVLVQRDRRRLFLSHSSLHLLFQISKGIKRGAFVRNQRRINKGSGDKPNKKKTQEIKAKKQQQNREIHFLSPFLSSFFSTMRLLGGHQFVKIKSWWNESTENFQRG